MNSTMTATSIGATAPASNTDSVEWLRQADTSMELTSRPTPIRGFLRPFGIGVVMALSPLTAVADPWVVEPRRQSQPTAFVLVHTSRRRISRAEALRVAMEILRKAEQERLDLADWEAERGIDWGEA